MTPCSFFPTRDPDLQGRMVAFKCKNTEVARQLTELMALAENNNRGPFEDWTDEPDDRPNIHKPTLKRLSKSFYLNETAPVGTLVFKVGTFSVTAVLYCKQ